jgi:hypothetical protein
MGGSFFCCHNSPIPVHWHPGKETKMDSGLIGLFAVGLFVVFVVSLFSPSTTFRCKKCDFTTGDKLRAAGHVALENTHKCEEC